MSGYRNFNRIILFVIILALIKFTTNLTATQAFQDTEGHWAEKEIANLSSMEIITGFPNGNFMPEATVTRAQLAKMITEAMKLGHHADDIKGLSSSFVDVRSSHWALPYIEIAFEYGLINGYDDNTFKPENSLNRTELAVMLVRGLEQRGVLTKASKAPLNFADEDQIPYWAREEIKAAVGLGLIEGFSDNTFKPEETATRAQTAIVLERFLKRLNSHYQFFGLVTGGDPSRSRIEIVVSGREYTFPVSSRVETFLNRTSFNWRDIHPGSKVYFNLNSKGEVSYLEMAPSNLHNSIEFSFKGRKNFNFAAYGERTNQHSITLTEDVEAAEAYSAEDVYQEENPGRGLEIAKEEIGALELTNRLQVTGRGIRVAVIDTGIDPGQPDLQRTANGDRKLVDFVDFTTEGIVETSNKTAIEEGRFKTDRGEFLLEGVASKSGEIRYGYLEKPYFTGVNSVLVVLVDTKTSGVYDTVYIDTSGRGDLSQSTPMSVFKDSGDVAFFERGNDRKFSLVIASLDRRGNWVQLGFDGHGHGTHVAGILAANGKLTGVAPGVELLAVKAITSDGDGDYETIARALEYAAKEAQIVNVSLGYFDESGAARRVLQEKIDQLSKEYGTIFVTAAGNGGPGLNTITTPGDAVMSISVGAYFPPRLWEENFGWQIEVESLWPFSSTGPSVDGALAPMILAPGSVVSLAPSWTGFPHFLDEGTSMSVPHVAGGIALLLEAAEKEGMTPSLEELKAALRAGARSIEHFQAVEQGYGVLDLVLTWEHLQGRNTSNNMWQLTTFNSQTGESDGLGLYAREFLPGKLELVFENTRNEEIKVDLSENAVLIPELTNFRIPSGGARRILAEYQLPEKPGLYTTTYYGLPITVVRPTVLDSTNSYRQVVDETVAAGQLKRHYFKIGDSSEQLSLSLRVLQDSGGRYQGRARIHVFDPRGREYDLSSYVGLSPEFQTAQGATNITIPKPMAGVWEVVIYSSPSLSSYNETESRVRLTANLNPVNKKNIEESSFVIGVLPVTLTPGREAELTLEVRSAADFTPYTGVLSIGGKLYQVTNGSVRVKIIPEGRVETIPVRQIQ